MSDYDKSLHRHDKKKQKMESRKAASEEVRLQTTVKNRQRGCKCDVWRQTVPNTCDSDRKSMIAVMIRLTADDVEPQSLPAGIVLRRGTMALSAADTCKQGRRA